MDAHIKFEGKPSELTGKIVGTFFQFLSVYRKKLFL